MCISSCSSCINIAFNGTKLKVTNINTPNVVQLHFSLFPSDGILWHSSAIEKRLDSRRLMTSSGSLCRLKGHMDKLQAKEDSKLTVIVL